MKALMLALLLAGCQSGAKPKTVHVILGFGRVCCASFHSETEYRLECLGGTTISNAANFFDTGLGCQERVITGAEVDPTVTLGR